MYTAALSFGLMLVPLGYYLIIEGKNPQMFLGGYFSVIAGITLFLISWVKALNKESGDKKDSDLKFKDLIKEIKGLRQDLRGDKNDHTDTDDRK